MAGIDINEFPGMPLIVFAGDWRSLRRPESTLFFIFHPKPYCQCRGNNAGGDAHPHWYLKTVGRHFDLKNKPQQMHY